MKEEGIETGVKQMRMEAGTVYANKRAGGSSKTRTLCHISRIRENLLCISWGPNEKDIWTEASDFAIQDPIAVGKIKKGLFWNRYILD